MLRQQSIRCFFLVVVALSSLSLAATNAAAQSDLNQHLDDQYKNKTFILRGFYSGSRLKYDSSGQALNPNAPQDWTVAGVVQVEHISLSHEHLKIDGRRLHLGWPGGGLQEVHDQVGRFERPEKEDRALRIEADLGAATAEAAEVVLSQIFLTSRDNFAALVPDYWKSCVSSGLVAGEEKKARYCRFSSQFLAIPGVAYNSDSQNNTVEKPGAGFTRVGHGVLPPKVLSQHEPEFSDEARRAKYQGTVVLGLVVDETGQPKNVHIVGPLGCGLDAQAVKTVGGWTFEPATKDGQPVAVELAVEVSFHLY